MLHVNEKYFNTQPITKRQFLTKNIIWKVWHDIRQIWKVCYDVPQIRKTLDYLKIRESVRSENLTKYYLCKEKFFCIFLSTLLDIQAQSKINHWISYNLMIICSGTRAVRALKHMTTKALGHLGTQGTGTLRYLGTRGTLFRILS